MQNPSSIAIVGIGGVFPGAKNLDEFWQNIVNARDCAVEVGSDRWRLPQSELYAPELTPDKVNSRRACLVENFEFNAEGLELDEELIRRLDPLYQILLHAGRDAWQDAKTSKLDKSRTGIIIGNIALPTESSSQFSDETFKKLFEQQLNINAKASNTETLNRYVAGLPGGLLAQALGLGAGAYTLDAACASSLYSLKYAIDELLACRVDAMLAGGVSRPDSLYTQMGFSQLGAISKTGTCSPFDSKADGLVVGEGAGIFVLKRLDDAINQGDHIYATIEGIGLSNDIEGSLMSPDSEGQLRAMHAAYNKAAWSPNEVELIECHGTGTPVGDSIEFNSLNRLWQQHDAKGECVIGSVKSNVGHLLTGAGAAALMKILLAFKHKQLPPTANFTQASNKIDLNNSPFTVLSSAKEWKANGVRKAAISGFGFGGINAHVLLQEYISEQQAIIPEINTQTNNEEIAVVGIDTRLGPWHDQDSLVFKNTVNSTSPINWWGHAVSNHQSYSINELEIPLGRYRVPPNELKEMLPQQLLMLEVAANALDDAGLSELSKEQQVRTGVFIGIALDMNTCNFHFRWMQTDYAKQWLQSLGIELSDDELEVWVQQLREATGPALNANRTMGALGGIVASRIARNFHIGGPSFTVSSEETSGMHALQSAIRALQQHELDQAVVGAVDLAADLRAVLGQVKEEAIVADGATAFILKRLDDALADGDKVYATLSGIGTASSNSEHAVVESIIKASDDAECHLDEIDLICTDSQKILNLSSPALANTPQTNFNKGFTGAANGLMMVSYAINLLYQRVLPTGSSITHWLKDKHAGARTCLVNTNSIDSNTASVLVKEAGSKQEVQNITTRLFTIAAENSNELIHKIKQLSFSDETQAEVGAYRVALIAENEQEFKLAIKDALRAIELNEAVENQYCCYVPNSKLGKAKLAFVYPGSGNHFYGMGQELGVSFPHVLEQLQEENNQLASQFANGRFWQADNGEELTHEEVIFGQVWLGTFVSDVVNSFEIKPNAVIGYSLGETAGFFSTRTWKARDEMLDRIRNTTLFTEDLAGPCKSVQQAWGTDEAINWSLGVVYANVEQVNQVLADIERAYLLIVNTQNECVIGGDKHAIDKAISKLNVPYHPLSGVTTVHCEVAKPVAEAYRNLHIFETTPPEGVTFYSGIRGGAYEVNADTAADSILDQALTPFDYTKVINSAYEDGVRIFIEMGPGGSCSRMIDQILEDKPHYAKAICVKGQDSNENLIQVLARLYVEGVEMDLHSLQQRKKQEYKDYIKVKTGGKVFHVPHPPSKPIEKTVEAVKPNTKVNTQEKQEEQPIPMPMVANGDMNPIIQQMQLTEQARAEAQETFLRVSEGMTNTMASAITMQMQLLNGTDVSALNISTPETPQQTQEQSVRLNREQCMEFAVGSIGKVLGEAFAEIDTYPTRVRLPDEPLMLVDRILDIEGDVNSMTHGRVVTEHDVLPNAWYLDLGRIPTCIAVEAGQADLFLSGYLGVDHHTKGNAVYRLLDARITFHGPLPHEGQTIHYDIQIEHFFRQGDTWLFRFNFEGTVNGQPLLTMTHGCAGFFSQEELDAGQGVVLTNIEKQPQQGVYKNFTPLVDMQVESYSDAQLNALRQGDLTTCFGSNFSNLSIDNAVGLPSGRMTLVHRILNLDPKAGRYGIGQITGEADIHADDWFLTCHFVDDRVMPGTLMYECCLHTLRVYLLRMGWVGETDEFVYEPIIGEVSQLKCRGQVTENTKAVQYEITLKEIGYKDDGTPYVLADALMYADHRAVVQMKNMSVQLSGLKKAKLESHWQNQITSKVKHVLFDNDSIMAFAIGNPSEAFGERYKVFDQERKIARLPGPPYKFLDRIVSIENCEQWVLKAGAVIEAEYDVPHDEWYFTEDNQPYMPFAVLLEVALQPCGWLAAYLGSALTNENDISFRNLGGKAKQYLMVTPEMGTLTTKVTMTAVSQSGGMIIQHYDYEMTCDEGLVYKGNTYFGFFSKEALADQVGIREAQPYQITDEEKVRSAQFTYPYESPMPKDMMRMVDDITVYDPHGGPNQLGIIEGKAHVKADAWFFKAHFYEDPVWPGSLGLESFMQLLKVFAWERWSAGLQADEVYFESMALNQEHNWVYRGQILPVDDEVTIQAVITKVDDVSKTVFAEGFLTVDGRIIYQMNEFALRIAHL